MKRLSGLPRLCGLLVASALLAGLGAGCDSVNTINGGAPVGVAELTGVGSVITDPGLNDAARVVALRPSKVSGDLLRIEADLLNTRYTQERFSYMFEWFMDNQRVDTAMSNWEGQIIEAKQTLTIAGVAPNPRVNKFRLTIKKSTT